MVLSAGVTHSVQYGLAALLKAVNDGNYKYRDDVMEYGEKGQEDEKNVYFKWFPDCI